MQPPRKIIIDGIREETHIVEEPPSLFHVWWSMGLPHHDEFHEFLANQGVEDFAKENIAIFLYTCHPHLKVSDPGFWFNEDGLPSKFMGENVTFKKIFEAVAFNAIRRKKRILEDVVLGRIIDALINRMLCPLCFRRGRLNLLEKMEDGYFLCRDRRCQASFKHPWKNSKLYNEFSEWWKNRTKIKLGRIKLLM